MEKNNVENFFNTLMDMWIGISLGRSLFTDDDFGIILAYLIFGLLSLFAIKFVVNYIIKLKKERE